MNYFVSPNCVMIEVLINPSSGQTVNNTPFTEQQQLLNRPIVAIEAFCQEDFIFSPLSSNIQVIPASLFNLAFLQINRTGNQMSKGKAGLYYKNVPLCALRRTQNNSTNPTAGQSSSFVRELFRVNPMFIQWPDSQVCFPTPSGQTQIYSVPFLIHYLLEGQDIGPYLQK